MNTNIIVKIPIKEKSYSLYALGIVTNITNKQDFFNLEFLSGTVIALFYSFSNYKRAYLVTNESKKNDQIYIKLPGIDSHLYMLYKAKGKKSDELKTIIDFFIKKDKFKLFTLPIEFWIRLVAQIEFYGNSKEEILFLYNKYFYQGK